AGTARVDAHSDIAGLLVDGRYDGAGIRIESVERIVIANGLNDAADQGLEIDVGFGGNFAGDDNQSGGGESFARDAAHRVFAQAGIENSVRNLVGDLVGMAFGHGLRRKEITIFCWQASLLRRKS